VIERGGTVAGADFAGYETIDREPVRARFGGCEILTNPPPSSGGILIAYALELLTRAGGATDPASVVAVMREAQEARTREFHEGLHEPGFANRFLGDRLGIDLYLVALFAFGWRIFQNVAVIRRHFL